MAAFRTLQQAGCLIPHTQMIPELQAAKAAEDTQQQQHQVRTPSAFDDIRMYI